MAIVKRIIIAERIEFDVLPFSSEVKTITPEIFHSLYCALSINLTGRNLANDWGTDAVCFSIQHELLKDKYIIRKDGDSFRLNAKTLELLRCGLYKLSESEDSLISGYKALNRTLGNL